MPLTIHNTIHRREETFEPIAPPLVRFYTCGPTVYDYAHIGNFRSFLNADLLRRVLEYLGYEVRHVMNITDVGHMVDDALADGGGEDKLEVARRRLRESKKAGTLPEGLDVDPDDPFAVADFYADAFVEDARLLGIKVAREAADDPDLLPRPTRYVEGMIRMVERLLERGHAYVAPDGVVYFDVQSFPDYGMLSGNSLDRLRSGAGGRVDAGTQALKKHPADFMIWKPDPTHLMRWPSPWGEGYPGWHLECSVMALDLLADETDGEIDIHSGGEDNIFPHHECEIAQSRCVTGRPRFARTWFHTRHLMVEGAKMSKSAGNFHTVRDVLARGYQPAALRLELLKTHYRVNANFTFRGLKDSQRMVERWRVFLERAETGPAEVDAEERARIDAVEADFRAALEADLNVAGALGAINGRLLEIATPGRPHAELLRRVDGVLGLLELETDVAVAATTATTGDDGDEIDPAKVEQLIAERAEARTSRDFARADAIRDELAAMRVEIKDSPEGTTWSRMLGE